MTDDTLIPDPWADLYAEAEWILTDAIAVIEEDGWCQGILLAADGRVCMLGAMSTVMRDHMDDRYNHQPGVPLVGWGAHLLQARRLALALLCDVIGEYVYVDDWNDRPGRSVEDVLLAFKGAVEAAHLRTPPSRDAVYRYLRHGAGG